MLSFSSLLPLTPSTLIWICCYKRNIKLHSKLKDRFCSNLDTNPEWVHFLLCIRYWHGLTPTNGFRYCISPWSKVAENPVFIVFKSLRKYTVSSVPSMVPAIPVWEPSNLCTGSTGLFDTIWSKTRNVCNAKPYLKHFLKSYKIWTFCLCSKQGFQKKISIKIQKVLKKEKQKRLFKEQKKAKHFCGIYMPLP